MREGRRARCWATASGNRHCRVPPAPAVRWVRALQGGGRWPADLSGAGRCAGRRAWWGWTDRLDEPLDACPQAVRLTSTSDINGSGRRQQPAAVCGSSARGRSPSDRDENELEKRRSHQGPDGSDGNADGNERGRRQHPTARHGSPVDPLVQPTGVCPHLLSACPCRRPRLLGSHAPLRCDITRTECWALDSARY